MIERLKAITQRWGRVAAILLLLAAIVLVGSWSFRKITSISPSQLTPLSLDRYHRLLILAPHCDDETLGAAGLILAAQRAGIQVRVVIATNGDGSFLSTAQDFRKIYPHQQDYIHMGEVRQRESLAALALLGVNSEQVTFLSYPDRGAPSLWNDYWSAGNPYRSPYSGDTKSPYQLTYNPKSVYAGEDYLADLKSILEDYHPDVVVYPHPEDMHPDHWGVNVFTRLAIALVKHADSSYHPAEYTYLVHRPDFPVIRGLKPQESLTPPPALFSIYPNWFRLDLTAGDVALKGQALQQYHSQLPRLNRLLESFVRQNELFALVTDVQLPALAQGQPLDPSTWLDASGQPIVPVQLDPVSDIFSHYAVPSSDLVAVYAARDAQGDLLACSQVRDDTSAETTYVLRLKALTASDLLAYSAKTGELQSGWHSAKRSGPYACLSVPLTELGDPWAIYLGAAVEGLNRMTLDQSAWQMVYVGNP